MIKLLLIATVLVVAIVSCDGATTTYDVYYWKNLRDEKPEDNIYVGNVNTLRECEASAIQYAKHIREIWNYRAYICMKKINGSSISKHRYGEPQ
jgi:hypothetical protein